MTVYIDEVFEFPGSRSLPHYDLRPSKRKLAVKFGAIEKNAAGFIAWRKEAWPREKIDKELNI